MADLVDMHPDAAAAYVEAAREHNRKAMDQTIETLLDNLTEGIAEAGVRLGLEREDVVRLADGFNDQVGEWVIEHYAEEDAREHGSRLAGATADHLREKLETAVYDGVPVNTKPPTVVIHHFNEAADRLREAYAGGMVHMDLTEPGPHWTSAYVHPKDPKPGDRVIHVDLAGDGPSLPPVQFNADLSPFARMWRDQQDDQPTPADRIHQLEQQLAIVSQSNTLRLARAKRAEERAGNLQLAVDAAVTRLEAHNQGAGTRIYYALSTLQVVASRGGNKGQTPQPIGGATGDSGKPCPVGSVEPPC